MYPTRKLTRQKRAAQITLTRGTWSEPSKGGSRQTFRSGVAGRNCDEYEVRRLGPIVPPRPVQRLTVAAVSTVQGHGADCRCAYCLSLPRTTTTGCSPRRQAKFAERATLVWAPKPRWSAVVTSGRSPAVCVVAAKRPATNINTSRAVPSRSAAHPPRSTFCSSTRRITSTCPDSRCDGIKSAS